jgi:peptidoglycan/LPS O-acetylase OafA/YrhL
VGLGGAAALAGSLFLPWYDVDRPPSVGPVQVSGWAAFDRIDAALVAIAVLAVPCLVAPPRGWARGARIVLGVLATVLVAWKLVALPLVPPEAGALSHTYLHATSVLAGPFVALAGAVALAASGALAVLTAAPPRTRAAPAASTAGGPEISQAGELRSARIESLRAVAALGVLLGHTYAISHAFGPGVWDSYGSRLVTGGGAGVYLFLVLSGYLLFWPFAKGAFGDGTPLRLGRYALNRAVRILPLYYAVLLVLLGLQHGGGSLEQWWRFGLFFENFARSTIAQVDSPMWTLAVEVQFYVALPFLAWGLARVSRGSVRAAALWLGGLFVAGLVLRLAVDDFRAHYSLLTLLHFFAAGMLLALLRLAVPRLPGVLARSDLWIVAAGVLYLVLCVNLFDLEALAAPASVLLIGACVLPLHAGRLVRVLEWRPLAIVGVASYSLYLWHVPVLLTVANASVGFDSRIGGVFVGAPTPFWRLFLLGVPLAVAVALASYAAIERPFLRLRRGWSGPVPGVSAARRPRPRPWRTADAPAQGSAAP